MQLDFAHHCQRWLGLQERELFHWFRRFGRDINTAFDIGANDGVYTFYFLARSPAHKIYSFEPSPDRVRDLQENLALNNLAGDRRLEIVARRVGASIAEGQTTLDSWVSAIVSPCLLKVDIDGGERDLLSGATQLLALPGIRWIIEVHSKDLEQHCLQVLREAGYHVEIVHNAWWRHVIPELRPGELNHWLVAYRDGEKPGDAQTRGQDREVVSRRP